MLLSGQENTSIIVYHKINDELLEPQKLTRKRKGAKYYVKFLQRLQPL